MNQIITEEKTVFIILSEIDFRLINHVKKLRQGKFSQNELSARLGMNKNFVGNVESLTQPQKYGTRHLALLSKAFGFKTIGDLLDFPTPEHDRIRIELQITKTFDANGKLKSKQTEIKNIDPIN